MRAPSGQAAAPRLLSECRGRSDLSLVMSLLIPSSSLSFADRAFKLQDLAQIALQPRTREGPGVLWSSLPGSSMSAADEPLLRGFKAREQPGQ